MTAERMSMEQLRGHLVDAVPSTEDLRKLARKRMPRFAFEYLDGGCNEDVNLKKNTDEIRALELEPCYLGGVSSVNTDATVFGRTYSAPFGVAPIGLQGLMWPGCCEILATAAKAHDIPFVLSTVSTASLEKIAEITDGDYWFQLYYPAEEKVRLDLLDRVKKSGADVLVVLSDVPTFGYRPRDIRNGLAMPPKMTLSNIMQMMFHPAWTLGTLIKGTPEFKSLTPYIPPNLSMAQLGKFMNDTFDGRLNSEKLKELRDLWDGKLVVKGIVNEADVDACMAVGVDGIIVSNHGGRQLDAGESTIAPLKRIVRKYSDKLTIMMDSGIRGGPDIARTIAAGAHFTFLGRTFMYGVGALGEKGGNHTIAMLRIQLQQVLEQLGCKEIQQLHEHLRSETPL